VVQEQFETFLAQVESKTGAGLPQFVKDEFEAYLECGILAHGFLRVRCSGCAHEKLVAFSCKRRGFCPSCGGRRVAESAAHLVDQVIRQVRVSFGVECRLCRKSNVASGSEAVSRECRFSATTRRPRLLSQMRAYCVPKLGTA
jgi:ribosomal protein S27E